MLERRRIVELARTGTAEVLITLVRVEGSSYRRPGARLLIAANNGYAGTISGGCLEAEVTRKAAWMVRNGSVMERYSTLFDDTAEIPYGLGCGGTVDLLFEPADTSEAVALFTALEASLTGTASTVLTWPPTPTTPLRRAILTPAGEQIFISSSLTETDLLNLERNTPLVYREYLQAPQRLILLGAGDDAKPVVDIANLLGWNVVVADGRAQLATRARFPQTHSLRHLPSPRRCAEELALTGTDAIVLMTHSYEQDRDCLVSILKEPYQRYIGILGARHRTSLLIAEAANINRQSVAEFCMRIHAPIGLDLGGDGPEAIALAIVAEIQASIQGKSSASGRLTAQEIETQLSHNPINLYHPMQCAATTYEEAIR